MTSDERALLWHYLLPKQLITRIFGYLAAIEQPTIKNRFIRRFIRKYGINMEEACSQDINAYPSFNAFFIRHLKPDARPISDADIISPVDGFVSAIGAINHGTLIQAKGHTYTVRDLLAGDEVLSSSFEQGHFTTLYLSPKDYHRVHMPINGTLLNMTHVPGKLFSVQPLTVNAIPTIFARNERLIVIFETTIGKMAMVLVGATIVGAIGTTWSGDLKRKKIPTSYDYSSTPITLKKGDEMGYFKLGSTVILLFAGTSPMTWNSALQAGDAIRLGTALGMAHITQSK